MVEKIGKMIKDFVDSYPAERKIGSIWKEPLVGFESAQDPGFLALKKAVSPSHALPQDFLQGAETVIAYFLPFAERIAESNIDGASASKEWAEAYIETNKMIFDLNSYLKAQFAQLGYASVIIPATHNFDEKRLMSDWSHRHVAAIAGLGTFGLNNMLITDKGCCGRIGSLITDIPLTLPKIDAEERCLYKYNSSCGKCVERCENNALTLASFDRHKCYEACLHNSKVHEALGFADVCGKCLVNLPCSFTNPVKKLKKF